METLQNLTTQNQTPVIDGEVVSQPKPLTIAQEHYITFVAAHGLSVEEDGTFTRISATDFAQKLAVSRQTLYDWQKNIPDFWARVAVRRKEIFTQNRENAIWRGLTLRAMKGDAKQAEMILSHFSDYVPPTQKHELKISGLAELANVARQKKAREE